MSLPLVQGPPRPVPTFQCAFCPRHGSFALNDKAVCDVCIRRLVHTFHESAGGTDARAADPDTLHRPGGRTMMAANGWCR